MKKMFVLWLLCGSVAWAGCPKGDTEWEGACTVDIQPETAEQTYKPSTEKPPRNPQPAWETGNVKVVDIKPQETVDDEIKAAQDEDARLAGQGKKP